MDKRMALPQAVEMIHDGDRVAIGGNVLHRAPMAVIREMIRQKKRQLRIIKTAGAMDVDMLCMGGCVSSVDAGFISYETEYSLAGHYRKAVQSGTVVGNEHACYTVISALRAASYGVGFTPVRGLITSDLIEENDYFKRVTDPFSGETITVVKALVPEVAVIHVQEADEKGNAYISGPLFEDVLMSRAEKKVIITAEHVVREGKFSFTEQKAQIPHFLVNAVVKVEKGAWPCSCLPAYDMDRKGVEAFKQLQAEEELMVYVTNLQSKDNKGR